MFSLWEARCKPQGVLRHKPYCKPKSANGVRNKPITLVGSGQGVIPKVVHGKTQF